MKELSFGDLRAKCIEEVMKISLCPSLDSHKAEIVVDRIFNVIYKEQEK